MWLKSTKEDRYFNLDKCLRCYRDGANGWAFLQDDGNVIHITDSDMETAKRFIDPEKIHPHDHDGHKEHDEPSVKNGE